MTIPKSLYVCQSCGAAHAKWSGKCPSCGTWDTLVEERPQDTPLTAAKQRGAAGRTTLAFTALGAAQESMPCHASGISELDRVLGGGFVAGSVTLAGGDPGIGKSTLLLQTVAALARQGISTAYISGEESVGQIQLRARRLGVAECPVQLAATTSVRDILTAFDRSDAPQIAVIDSIQTMHVDLLDSAPGTVAQVRASAHELIRLAKRRGIALLLVGHVTKDGQIAGPRVLEHMVDTVLYFEGDRGHQFRIVRSVKNRFGGTDEIGVFEMTESGLREVPNPSSLFLSAHDTPVSGAAVCVSVEGSRPFLVEIQALVAPSMMATPRRAVVGWDGGRLAMILAVLEARCGIRLGDKEVYLNVAGGFRVTEPAADLAVAAAILSALYDAPMPMESVVFGELGLSGEVRPVGRSELRLKEAARLGFTQAFYPADKRGPKTLPQQRAIHHLRDMVCHFRPEEEAA